MPTVIRNVILSPEEYLEGEKYSDIKHEYENGRIIAMVGASRAHNTIQVNLTALLHHHLRATPCRVFSSDMKVRIDNTFYYPDLSIVCREYQSHDYYVEEPILVIEVLSPTTEQRDRTIKRLTYQQLPGLKEYVLVAQKRMLVDIYRRSGDGWDLEQYQEGDEIRFRSIDLALSIGTIYENIPLP